MKTLESEEVEVEIVPDGYIDMVSDKISDIWKKKFDTQIDVIKQNFKEK